MTGLFGAREIAYALAYALTDTRPDAELLQAASTGKLATLEQVATQVARMLGETKLPKPRILGFSSQVFRIRRGNRRIQGRSAQPQSRTGRPW